MRYTIKIIVGYVSVACVACLVFIVTCCTRPVSSLKDASSSDVAATPSPTNPVDQILARYTQAVGGEEAVERLRNYRARGTFRMSIIPEPGTFEVWVKDPDKSLTVVTFPRVGVIKKGRDGDIRWSQTPFGTNKDEEGPNEFTGLERDSDLYRAGKIKEMYESIKLEGSGRLQGREVSIVEAKPAKGPSDKLLFDKETGLLLRWDMVRKSPKRGNVFVKVHLDDYREVGGLKLPFTVRYAFESFSMTLTIEELQQNVSVDDAMFRKPAGK